MYPFESDGLFITLTSESMDYIKQSFLCRHAETGKDEKTASPMGVIGLISGLGVAVAVFRRK